MLWAALRPETVRRRQPLYASACLLGLLTAGAYNNDSRGHDGYLRKQRGNMRIPMAVVFKESAVVKRRRERWE